ncbi:hypothetical protein [Jannaschia sp. R86511]|uniref:hypothetical protein n=1 Tax=Jannaschia sp. R86511 TaxID=3093853 RepID=UPI0036D3CECD
MLLWVNGAFGAGKTTAAEGCAATRPDTRVFDPELVGFLLRRLIVEPVDDFQSRPAWRALVAETAVQLQAHYGGDLLAPMSLLHRPWAEEVFERVAAAGVVQGHVLLHVAEPELRRRIETDEVEAGARQWRLDAVARYRAAEPWLRTRGWVLDTTRTPRAEVQQQIGAWLDAA